MARARMYFALMVLAGVAGAWIEQRIQAHTLPVRPAAFYVLAIVPFGLVCLLLMLRAWDRADAQRTLPAQAAWPHDPDPTEALTRPMSDPYATRPYDPRSDVTTVIMQPLDDSRMLWPDDYDNAPTEWDG